MIRGRKRLRTSTTNPTTSTAPVQVSRLVDTHQIEHRSVVGHLMVWSGMTSKHVVDQPAGNAASAMLFNFPYKRMALSFGRR